VRSRPAIVVLFFGPTYIGESGSGAVASFEGLKGGKDKVASRGGGGGGSGRGKGFNVIICKASTMCTVRKGKKSGVKVLVKNFTPREN